MSAGATANGKSKHDVKQIRRAENLQKCGRIAEAEALYLSYLSRFPNEAIVHHNLGVLYQQRNEPQRAHAHYEKSICLPHTDNATRGDSMNNLGDMMAKLGEDDKAAICFALAAQWNPNRPQIINNHAQYLIADHKYEEALAELARSIQLDPTKPEAKFNRGALCLMLGDFSRGWQEYESRWSWKGFSTKPFETDKPRWKGEDVTGKTVLLTAEQGFGDSIHFIRYAKMVKARGATVHYYGHELLYDLLRGADGVDHIVKPDEVEAFDYHCPLLSLPRIFNTNSVEEIPADVPYIRNSGWKPFYLPERKPDIFRIGICWAGSPRHAKDSGRSVKPQRFQPLLSAFPNVDWVSFQIGPKAAECAELNGVLDLSLTVANYTDTAQALRQIDLLVTVDTSVAHLAGALNVPVWMLTPYSPDWRWLLEREDSPWYPSMRLFRLPARGDWDSVFQRVEKELHDKVA